MAASCSGSDNKENSTMLDSSGFDYVDPGLSAVEEMQRLLDRHREDNGCIPADLAISLRQSLHALEHRTSSNVDNPLVGDDRSEFRQLGAMVGLEERRMGVAQGRVLRWLHSDPFVPSGHSARVPTQLVVRRGLAPSYSGYVYPWRWNAQAAPISAPPFGAVPINPFAFAPTHPHAHHTYNPPGSHLPMPTPMEMMAQAQSNTVVSTAGTPSYYLIPANGGQFMHAGGGMMPPSSPMGPPPVNNIFSHAPQVNHQSLMNLAVQGMVQQQPPQQGSPNQVQNGSAIEITTPWPKGAVVKPSLKYPRAQKIPGKNQFRDEIIIKNADSGKIMGVKGRRVAVVEEISKTIISFQKVVPGAKERSLTITGNTEESIHCAKLLIEETVRRNVSPNRPEVEVDPSLCEDLHELSMAERVKLEDENSNLLQYTIDSANPGVLKLTCDDPEMLQAAQEVLNKFFLRPGELTDEEKRLRKERRKSMPTFSPADSRAPSSAREEPNLRRQRRGSVHGSVDAEHEGTPSRETSAEQLEHRRLSLMTQSTPNLAPDGKAKIDESDNWRAPNEFRPETKPVPPPVQPKDGPHIVYTRDFLLQIADSPQVKYKLDKMEYKPDVAIRQEPPHNFSGAAYKSHCLAVRSAMLTRPVYE